MIRQFSRSTVAAILLGTALAVPFAPAALAQPCADPRGNSYCTNNGLVNMQNPNPPTNVNVQNPNAGNAKVTNPSAGNSNVQNPNAPIARAGGSQLATLNSGGAPGDGVVVTGQGFGTNNVMFLNVIDSSGTEWDTDSRAFSCNETDNWVVVIYQNYGLGCSSGAQTGRLNQSNADGTFTGVVQIPPTASFGPAKLCAKGVFATTCTPIMIGN